MNKNRVYKTEAIILKRSNLGEADSIITFLTPYLGKIRAVAKGVRRPRSKLGGHLDQLTQSSLLIACGKNLDIITQGQVVESFAEVKTNLHCIGCALYLAELVDLFMVEKAENYAVYQLLFNALLQLRRSKNKELFLRHFELHLLNHLGYKPELRCCPFCKKSLLAQRNYFSLSDGGVLCPDCAESKLHLYPLSVDALKVLRFISENDYVEVNRLRVDRSLSDVLEQITRRYIRYHLERDVKSIRFLDQLRTENALLEQASCRA